MPRIERKIKINAPIKRVFDILDDAKIGPKWNVAMNSLKEIEDGTYEVKSTVGDFTSIRDERVENKKISMKIEGGIFTGMGYNLSSKEGGTEVMLWGEFKDPKNEKMLTKAGELLLEGLKKCAEYLEKGGDIKKFDKKQKSVSP